MAEKQERKLETFRNFRTSKQRKQRVNKERNEEATREKILKDIALCVRKT